MCFNNVIQNGQVETDRQKQEPLKATKQLMSRLRTLEKQCGQLCDLEKPVAGGEDEFMGRVKAKVIKSHSILSTKKYQSKTINCWKFPSQNNK